MRRIGRSRPGLWTLGRMLSAGLVLGTVLGSACVEEPRTPGGSASSAELDSVYSRTEQRFSKADLFKPKHEAQTEEAVYRAPLILQEVTSSPVTPEVFVDVAIATMFRPMLHLPPNGLQSPPERRFGSSRQI